MNSIVGAVQSRHSDFQSLDNFDEPTGPVVFLTGAIRQAAFWSSNTWRNLPRLTRIVLIGMLITSSSFSLSMIVSVLSH